jgi:hypothetical protein
VGLLFNWLRGRSAPLAAEIAPARALPTSRGFQTTEVATLYAELRDWSHPVCPFLDQRYSPGSNMPMTDFTHVVANWLDARNFQAIKELWRLLTRAVRACPEAARLCADAVTGTAHRQTERSACWLVFGSLTFEKVGATVNDPATRPQPLE